MKKKLICIKNFLVQIDGVKVLLTKEEYYAKRLKGEFKDAFHDNKFGEYMSKQLAPYACTEDLSKQKNCYWEYHQSRLKRAEEYKIFAEQNKHRAHEWEPKEYEPMEVIINGESHWF